MANPPADPKDPGVRRVRTTEGARFFGLPVGTPIGNRFDPNLKAADRAVSLTRLQSLQRQFEAAKSVGDLSKMRRYQEQFTTAVREYAATNGQLTDILSNLIGQRGRADIALGKKKNLRD